MQRDTSLDLVKAVAILSVVLIHSVDTAIVLVSKFPTGSPAWFLYQTARALGRIGVPLFFMTSGALLLGQNSGTLDFYKKRLPQFVFLLFFVPAVYFVFAKVALGWDTNYQPLKVLTGHTGHAYQLWYLYAIIGLYLITPALRVLIQSGRNDVLVTLSIIPILVTFIPNALRLLGATDFRLPNMALEFTGAYFWFFWVGYVIYHKAPLKKVSMPVLALSLVLSLFVWIYAQYCATTRFGDERGALMWYTNIFCVVPSIVTFELVRRLKLYSKAINALSFASFSIFLWHLLPIFSFNTLINNNHIKLTGIRPFVAYSSIMILIGLIFGLFVYYVFRKVPYVRKLVA
ncbi:acyltransferase [Brucella anthropi]|uniref:acyltransferase n=1 Tax=Brucella anthropi TaxID=529 RepID=UPI0007750527|nr:acyltransferase [Brucella anthropi]KXO76684.1 hypothetical protein AYJ56_08635 [Brucella anthropi]